MPSSSVNLKRSIVSAEEFERFLLRIWTDDFACTATTSGGDAPDKPLIEDKWSLNVGRAWRLAGAVPGAFLISFSDVVTGFNTGCTKSGPVLILRLLYDR